MARSARWPLPSEKPTDSESGPNGRCRESTETESSWTDCAERRSSMCFARPSERRSWSSRSTHPRRPGTSGCCYESAWTTPSTSRQFERETSANWAGDSARSSRRPTSCSSTNRRWTNSAGRHAWPWSVSMADLPIRRIEARTYCHATEEEERVATALAFAVPEGVASREQLEGHFGNPLVRLTRRVEKRPAIRAVWSHWAAAGVPSAIARDIEARLDEDGVLHFRFDKQAAFRERLELAGDSDPIDIRLKLIAYPAKPADDRQSARDGSRAVAGARRPAIVRGEARTHCERLRGDGSPSLVLVHSVSDRRPTDLR